MASNSFLDHVEDSHRLSCPHARYLGLDDPRAQSSSSPITSSCRRSSPRWNSEGSYRLCRVDIVVFKSIRLPDRTPTKTYAAVSTSSTIAVVGRVGKLRVSPFTAPNTCEWTRLLVSAKVSSLPASLQFVLGMLNVCECGNESSEYNVPNPSPLEGCRSIWPTSPHLSDLLHQQYDLEPVAFVVFEVTHSISSSSLHRCVRTSRYGR